MASSMSLMISAAFAVIMFMCSTPVYSQLSAAFYAKSCPYALYIVKAAVQRAVANEKGMAASGCDGSVLLDDSSTLTGEKTAVPNANSARGFDVIDNIKTQVENICSGVVSCADILAIAARYSVVELGGPSWTVTLGRRDSRTASKSAANNNIPAPTSSLNKLVSKFKAQGLSAKDMVTLSGAHTIGQARCTSFRALIYNESNVDKTFATSLRSEKCPNNGRDNNLSPLDLQTPTAFDNNYYKNLRSQKGLLHSDQQLFNGGSTDSLVTSYSGDQYTFLSDFAAAMVKMGNIEPLTGSSG